MIEVCRVNLKLKVKEREGQHAGWGILKRIEISKRCVGFCLGKKGGGGRRKEEEGEEDAMDALSDRSCRLAYTVALITHKQF